MRCSPQTRRLILIIGLLICLLAAASRSSFPHNQSAEQFLEKEILKDKLDAQMAPEQTNALINSEVYMSWSAAGIQQVKPVIFDYGVIEGKYQLTEKWRFDGGVIGANKLSGKSLFLFRNIEDHKITKIEVSGIVHTDICESSYSLERQIKSCSFNTEFPISIEHVKNSIQQTEYGNLIYAEASSPVSLIDFDNDNENEIMISIPGQGTRHHDFHLIFEQIDIDRFSSSEKVSDVDYGVPNLRLSYYFNFRQQGAILFEIGPNSWCSGRGKYYKYQTYKYEPIGHLEVECD